MSAGILQQYLEDYAKKFGKYSGDAKEYNASVPRGPTGDSIAIVSNGYAGKSTPALGKTVVAGGKKLKPLGFSGTEFDVNGNPAMTYGTKDGTVYFVDYGTNPYNNTFKVKGERFYTYHARTPNITSSDAGTFQYVEPINRYAVETPEEGKYYYRADESGNYDNLVTYSRDQNGALVEQVSDARRITAGPTGKWAIGHANVTYDPLPGVPDSPGNAPTFTQAQYKKLAQGDTSQRISAAVRGSGGVIGRFLGRDEEED